jgi:hypothetical protein
MHLRTFPSGPEVLRLAKLAEYGADERLRELLGDLRRQTLMRILAFVSVVFGLLITTGNPAAADCSGPTIEIEQREVVRGAPLAVTGYAWGDNCYDTGAPPDGEGVLGVPIGGIDVYVVQGTEEFLVATGAADDEYSFEVTIVIPAELTAGTAIVQARWAANRIAYSENPQIVVTDASPLVSDEPTVATFEPVPTTTTADSTTNSTVAPTSAPSSTVTAATDAPDPPPGDGGQPDQDSNTTTTLVIVGVAALSVLLLAVRIARRRNDPRSDVPRFWSRCPLAVVPFMCGSWKDSG